MKISMIEQQLGASRSLFEFRSNGLLRRKVENEIQNICTILFNSESNLDLTRFENLCTINTSIDTDDENRMNQYWEVINNDLGTLKQDLRNLL